MTSTIAQISGLAHLRNAERIDDGDPERTADSVGNKDADRSGDRDGDADRNRDDHDAPRNADRNGGRKGVRDNSSRSVLCMAEASSLMAGFAPTCSAL
jgi:hypothetical protein